MKTPLRVVASEPTLASSVLDRLRSEIVRGRLAPGDKLRLEHIAQRYGVGRTPLREACCRLAAEGLVSILDQRGFRVTPISRRDLLDLTRTRQQIETLALRASMANGDAAWEKSVVNALQHILRLAKSTRGSFSSEWHGAHEALHVALLSACDSPWLLRFRAVLFEQSERYRRLAVAGITARDVDGEHRAIVKAALDRDVERACALLVVHIAATTDRVLAMHPALAEEASRPPGMSTK